MDKTGFLRYIKNLLGTTDWLKIRQYISKGKWAVQINIDGEQKHLGYYNTKGEAIHAREIASRNYNYASSHGS